MKMLRVETDWIAGETVWTSNFVPVVSEKYQLTDVHSEISRLQMHQMQAKILSWLHLMQNVLG